MLQVPVNNITQITTSDPNQIDADDNTKQDNTSTLYTSNTRITQPFQTQQHSPRKYIHLPIDHLHDQEIPDILDIVHIQIQGKNPSQYNHKPKMIQLISKYRCITQLKWQTL